MKSLKAEMDASVTSMQKMQSAEEGTAKKADILARSIEAGKKKIEVLQAQYDRSREKLEQLGKALDDAKRDFGENSDEALKAENAYNRQAKAVNDLGTQLNKAKADVNKMTSELDELGDESSDASKDVDKLGDELDDTAKSAKKAGDQGTKLGTIFKGTFFANIATQALSKLAQGLRSVAQNIIEVTSSTAASTASYKQIMGDYLGDADAKLKELSKDTGLYSTLLRDDLTSNVAKFKGLGYDMAESLNLAAQATRLTADAAAFNDKTYEEAAESLASFVNGQYRAGQSIKLFANDTQMANYAVEQGIISSTKEWAKLDEAIKQATRLDYAENMYEMSGVLGQSKRESGEWLIVTQNLKAAWEDFLAKVGTPLLEALVPVLQTVTEKLTAIIENVDWDSFTDKVSKLFNFILDNGKAIAAALGIIAVGFAAVSIAASPITLLAVAIAACVAATVMLKNKVEELTGVDMPTWASTFLAAVAGGPTLAMAQLKAATEDEIKTAEGWRQTHFKAAQDIASASLQTSQAWANAMNSMKAKMSEMAATAKAKATEIAQKFMALPGQMLKIGADIVAGLWQGIKTRSQWLIDQIKGFCQSVVNGIKNFFKIASPSKLMRDQIGVMLMRGMANGIKLGGPEVTKAMKRVGVSVLDVAETILDMVAKKEAELTEAMKAEGLDAARKEALQTQLANVQNFSKEFTAALDAVEKKQESLTDKLRSYGNLIETVSRKGGSALGAFGGVDGIQSEVNTLERYGEILEQIKALGVSDDFLADFLATDIDSAIEYAEKLLQLPDAKREEYLALEGQRREMQKIVEETRAAEKSQAVALADINEQVKALEEYDRILEELKRRGTPAELMNEIAGMSVEDATTYGQLLLDMSGKDFDEYIASWKKKQETAAKIAEKFYQGELDALVEDFASKIPAEMDGMVDDMYQVGVAAGKGLVAGLESERFAIIDVARSIAADARAALQTQEGIHSPSTKWAELGGYMAQGVAVGFAKTMQAVSPGIMQSVSSVRTSDIERVGSGIVNGLNAGTGGGISIEVPLVINGREFARAVLSDLRAVGKSSPEVVYG